MNDSTAVRVSWRDALLLAVLAPVLIAGCFSAGFLNYDDDAHYRHELMRPGVPLRDFWKPTDHSTYFPVTILSYRFDRWLYETVLNTNSAPGVRIDSLLLHIAAGIILWRFLWSLGTPRWMAFFAAAGWTVHPAACESVCWISERKNVLAAFFGFASVWAYSAISRTWLRTAATAVLFALAMLSKPTAAGFLPVLILYDLLIRNRNEGQSRRFSALIPRAVLYFALTALIAGLAHLNISTDKDSSVQPAGGSYFTVALTDVPVLLAYIRNSICPSALSIFHFQPIVHSLANLQFWIALFIMAGLFCASFLLSGDRKRTLFLWGWFVGALGPALNIIPLPFLIQDRFAYFSLSAILLIFGEFARDLFVRFAPLRPGTGRLAALAAVGLLAGCAFLRSGVFRNDLELFTDAVTKEPQSSYAQLFLGLTLTYSADVLELAGAEDSNAIRSAREEALRRIELAENAPDFERLLDPGRVPIIRGALLERLGAGDQAYPLLIAALTRPQKPFNNVVACQTLARIELSREHAEAAVVWARKAATAYGQTPTPEILFLLAECLEKANRRDEAIAVYREIPSGSLAYPRAQTRIAALTTSKR